MIEQQQTVPPPTANLRPERRSRGYSKSLVDPYAVLDVFINSEDLVMNDAFDNCGIGQIHTGELQTANKTFQCVVIKPTEKLLDKYRKNLVTLVKQKGKLIRGLNSPFLPRFLGLCGDSTATKFYVLNEIGTFKPAMTLKSALKSRKIPLDWVTKIKIALDISQIAVSFHSMQRIPFLDVFNIENFLIDIEGRVKICDIAFALAKNWDPDESHQFSTQKKGFNHAQEAAYQFGLVLFEICTHVDLSGFIQLDTFEIDLTKARAYLTQHSVPVNLIALFSACTTKEVHKRPNFNQIISFLCNSLDKQLDLPAPSSQPVSTTQATPTATPPSNKPITEPSPTPSPVTPAPTPSPNPAPSPPTIGVSKVGGSSLKEVKSSESVSNLSSASRTTKAPSIITQKAFSSGNLGKKQSAPPSKPFIFAPAKVIRKETQSRNLIGQERKSVNMDVVTPTTPAPAPPKKTISEPLPIKTEKVTTATEDPSLSPKLGLAHTNSVTSFERTRELFKTRAAMQMELGCVLDELTEDDTSDDGM